MQSEFVIISIENQKLTANCFLEIFGGILAFNDDAATQILTVVQCHGQGQHSLRYILPFWLSPTNTTKVGPQFLYEFMNANVSEPK